MPEGGQNSTCRGNIRPAPFALTEGMVRDIVEDVLGSMARRGLIELPLVQMKLVDQPRRSEDPRLAKANDDIDNAASTLESLSPRGPELQLAARVDSRSSPEEGSDYPKPTAGGETLHEPAPCGVATAAESVPAGPDQSGRADASEIPSEPELGSHPGESGHHTRSRRGNFPVAAVSAPIETKARKADAAYRQQRDRDARALEQPVDRLALIRQAAARLAARNAPAPRVPAGIPTPRTAMPLPPTPGAALRARLEAATTFLKGKCILVQVIDRHALVREYRITGSTHRYLAQGVIEHAERQGFGG